MTTKIYCPKCNAQIEAEETAIADGLLCQLCGHDFVAAVPLQRTAPENRKLAEAVAAIKRETPSVLTAEGKLERRREEIRNKAEWFEWASVCAVTIGIVVLIFGIVLGANDVGGYWVAGLGGVMISLGPWFYLLAQIVHIRANTER